MGRGLLAGVLLVAACGRLDFDHRPDPHTNVLRCGEPARLSLGVALDSLNAVATPAGFAIVGVDGARNLRGWTYDWTYAALAGAQDVSLGSDVTTTAGVALDGDGIVVASIYGAPMPIGTRLHALGMDLAPRAPASSLVGVMAGDGPIARGGGEAAQLALVSVDPMTDVVTARRVDMQDGAAGLAPPRTVVESAEEAGAVRLAAARDGYVLSWTSAAGSPNCTRVARFDRDLGLVAGPVTVKSGADENAIRPAVAWLPEADRYLVAWYEKIADGESDDVWYQVLDGGLAPVTPARRLAAGGVRPQIGTDGEQFFVAWRDLTADPRGVAAAAIAPDGAVTPQVVSSSGGEARGHAFVERNGQAVLVWSEAGGDGPDLWLEPMCP